MSAPEALGELAVRFGLPAAATRQLGAILDLLERDPGAPTAVTAGRQALDLHVADSLVALELAEVREAAA